MKCLLWLFLFSLAVNCEWVEIAPIIKKSVTDIRQIIQTTTPANQEFIINNPLLNNNEESTTSIYNLSPNDHNQKTNSTFENYNTSSTTEINIPITSKEVSESNENREEFEKVSEQKNENIYETFFLFLKMIQNNLLKYKNYNSRKSKLSILKHLKDHLLVNIKERFTFLFKSPEPSFEARGYKDDDDNHMDFPSNEGALMTIGFLTFAVFLIKLIIKLVHALKYKQQYYGSTTTTTAASVVFLKRRKRDEEHMEAAKILQYIEEF